MKKSTILSTVAIISTSMVLSGCTVTPHVNLNGNVEVNGSEVFSESFSYEPNAVSGITVNGKGGNTAGEDTSDQGLFPGGLDDDGKDPNEGKFPGGLDDDGRDPNEAVVCLLEIESNNEEATHKGIVRGLNMAGGTVWTYETDDIYVGQVDNIQEVDYFDGKYIIVVEGKVIALDVETGKELYVNEDFRGSGIAWSTNYEGDKLYMCGYFGPDVFVMDVNTGKTLNRITAKDPDIYWAYQIDYINEHQVDVTYENIEKAVSYDPEGPEEQ